MKLTTFLKLLWRRFLVWLVLDGDCKISKSEKRRMLIENEYMRVQLELYQRDGAK